MPKNSLIIGIDPGKSGAVAVKFRDEVPKVFDVPVGNDGKKNRYDLQGMVKMLADHVFLNDTICAIEEVHAMPGQGVTSMFEMGYGLGLWHMGLSFLGVPIHRIRPQVWKKEFGLLGTEKDASRLKAIELFPSLYGDLKLKKHDGRADAILLAEFLYRKFSVL